MPDALANPGAVIFDIIKHTIHLENTTVTHWAVVGSWGFDNGTLSTAIINVANLCVLKVLGWAGFYHYTHGVVKDHAEHCEKSENETYKGLEWGFLDWYESVNVKIG